MAAERIRVESTSRTRGMRLGASGVVVDQDAEDGFLLIEWDGVESGPRWHSPDELRLLVDLGQP